MEGVAAQPEPGDHGQRLCPAGVRPRAPTRARGTAAASPSCMPLRFRSNGRHRSELIARDRAKPSIAIRENGSTPPATAASTAPDRTGRRRRTERVVPGRARRPVRAPRAVDPEGPRHLGREDAADTLVDPQLRAFGRLPRRPPTRPSSSRRRRRCDRSERARRRAAPRVAAGPGQRAARRAGSGSPRSPSTRQARCTGKPSATRSGHVRLAVSPSRRRAQSVSGSEPSGVSQPTPVTTTRSALIVRGGPARTRRSHRGSRAAATRRPARRSRKRYSSLATNSTMSSESTPSSAISSWSDREVARDLRVDVVQLEREGRPSISARVEGAASAVTR